MIASEQTPLKITDRFPGPKPYQESEKNMFFGRAMEIQELYDSIVIHDMLLLHAESGLGKSSLINAGLLPKLRQEGYFPILFRFKDRKKTPVQNVLDEITAHLIEHEIPADMPEKHLLWYKIRLLCTKFSKIVMIFDQLEEFALFTRTDKEAFLQQLSEAFTNAIPDFFRLRIKEAPEAYEHDAWYWQPPIKCLFSLRSDKLAVIEEIAIYFPTIARARVQLGPIKWEYTKQLVYFPTQLEQPGADMMFSTLPFTIAEDVIEHIRTEVQDTKKNSIETTQLQMICQEIESVVKEKQTTNDDKINITSEDFDADKLKKIATEFYTRQLKKLEENKSISKAECNAVRQLIEKKMLIQNMRVPQTRMVIAQHFIDYFSRNDETIEDDKIDEIINLLLELRLLRDQQYGDTMFYEIPHDALKEGIKQEREKREKTEKEKAERKEKKRKEKEAMQAAEKQQQELEEKNEQIRQKEEAFNVAAKATEAAEKNFKKLKKTRTLFLSVTGALAVIAIIAFVYTVRFYRQYTLERTATIIRESHQYYNNGQHYKAFRALMNIRNFFNKDTCDKLIAAYDFADISGNDFIFSDDNRRVISLYPDSTADFWDISGANPKRMSRLRKSSYFKLSSKGNFVAAVDSSDNLRLIDYRNKKKTFNVIYKLPVDGDINSLVFAEQKFGFSSNERYLWMIDSKEIFHLFCLDSFKEDKRLIFSDAIEINFSYEDSMALITRKDRSVRLYNLSSGLERKMAIISNARFMNKSPYLLYKKENKIEIYNYNIRNSLLTNISASDFHEAILTDDESKIVFFENMRTTSKIICKKIVDVKSLADIPFPDSINKYTGRVYMMKNLLWTSVGNDSILIYDINRNYIFKLYCSMLSFPIGFSTKKIYNNIIYYKNPSSSEIYAYDLVNKSKKNFHFSAERFLVDGTSSNIIFNDAVSQKLKIYHMKSNVLDSFENKVSIEGLNGNYLKLEKTPQETDEPILMLLRPKVLYLNKSDRIAYFNSTYPIN